MSYSDFFQSVCKHAPFRYQERVFESDADHLLIRVPTGLGKTEAVLAQWLKRRDTTRLVFCLPGRSLTSQIVAVAKDLAQDVQVLEIMGGGSDLHAKIRPDQPCIIVGTQDVLVSRALNRGYAQSPFRWPINFALLNNDVTWVFDEVQLLGDAVATSAQMASFRKQMGTFGRVRTIWMSATVNRDWLRTVDYTESIETVHVEAEDLENEIVRKRLNAPKSLEETTACSTPRECAAFLAEYPSRPNLALVIANTVTRAQEIWEELKKLDLLSVLLHSRFRPDDRKQIPDTGIVVATQVIEAGIDIDADLMITDIAPWPSLVQRFGRVNRRGERHGKIHWVRNPQTTRGKGKHEFAPYDKHLVLAAIDKLEKQTSAAPADLPKDIEDPAPYKFVLRRSDLLDLFDTTSIKVRPSPVGHVSDTNLRDQMLP